MKKSKTDKDEFISTQRVFSAFKPAGNKELRGEIREAIVDYELWCSTENLTEETLNQILKELTSE